MSATETDPVQFEGGFSGVVWGRNVRGEPGPQAWGQAGCETEIGIPDETVCVSGATDAPSASRPLAVPPLALSRRPALARARAARQALLLDWARAFDSRTSRPPSATHKRLRVVG